jgi:hypothetical protein
VPGRLKRHGLLKPTARLCDGSYLASIRSEHGPQRGERLLVQLVIDETDTHLRLCARTLRSLTPTGVIQELSALLLVHVLLRTLMLRAARPEGLAARRLSWTQTIALVHDSHVPLSLVSASRRQQMVGQLLKEMSTFRLPNQRVRIGARVRWRYDRKQPEHWHAPPLELDLAFHQIIAVVEGVPITSSP